MRIFLVGAISLIVTLNPYSPIIAIQHASAPVARPAPITMEALVDRYRPLLVFAPADKLPEFAEQMRLLKAGSKELMERQVLVVPVIAGSEANPNAHNVDIGYLLPGEVAAVRRRFHVGEDEFAVVLVGKDGGEKFRTHAPVTIETLDAVIDAMPMRRQEVRDGHAK